MRGLVNVAIAAVLFFTVALCQTTIAVVDFNAHGVSVHEAATLTDRLRNELFNTNKFRVLEREMMEAVLKEQGFQQTGCTSSECLVEIGQLIGVSQMIGGSIGKVGETYTVLLRVIDVETGEVVKTATRDVSGRIDVLLTTTIPQIARDIAGQYIPESTDLKNINVADMANMIFVPGGTFSMGSNDGESDERPVHKVAVSDFYMDKYEVTNEQFCQFLNEKNNQVEGGVEWLEISSDDCKIEQRGNQYIPRSGYAGHPVVGVNWYGANAYAEWAGKRLPTEAEWEYAARGGNKSQGYKYSGSNAAGSVAWYADNSGGKNHPVGTRQPNELGLYDMSGNVWEWCADWYGNDYYSNSPSANPTGPASGAARMLRGGSWSSRIHSVRCAYRGYRVPLYRYSSYGFRCVR